jgi:hypothetical protein
MAAQPIRENIPAMRRLLLPFAVLAGLGALQLYLFPHDTDRYFAWTLQPQLSATFMGAGFAAGVLLTILSYRRQPWAVTRTATFTIFVFTLVMTVATFLHLDKMHLGSGPVTARIAGWLWLAVYTVVTPVLGTLIVLQIRTPGVDPSRLAPLPRSLRIALVALGVAMLVIGGALFVTPTTMDGVWPWAITPLASRSLAAWIVAIGWAGLQVAYEDDVLRVRPAAATFAVIGVLWLLGAVRGSADMGWERVSAWVYVAFTIVATALGAWGWTLGRTQSSTRVAPHV